jgi:O-antigen/teichoic acid export membrane protein
VSIRRSLVYSYLDRYASLVLGIGTSMVIARLLTPADIGVFSVTMVLLALVTTVRDMGAGGYLVQEKELTIDRIRAVWTLQLGLGVLLCLLVLLASTPAAAFYGEPRMRDIMMVVALTYLINPFGSLTYAWQIREMHFDKLALVRFVSTLAGAVASIVLAWQGYGPLSLALGALSSTVANALAASYYRPSHFPWLPGLREIRRVLAFGSQTTGAAILQTFTGGAAELILGKLQDMSAVGFYSRANGLLAMFDRLVLSGIAAVAVPWFSRQSRDHGDISESFLRATSYVAAVGWSFAVTIAFLAFPIVRILYGDQWDVAVDLTRIMSLGMAFGVPAAMCHAAMMAVGAARAFLRVTASCMVSTITLVALGASHSLLAMGMCLCVAGLIRSAMFVHAVKVLVGFAWPEFWRRLRSSAAVGVASGIAPALSLWTFGEAPQHIWASISLGGAGAAVGFFSAVFILDHPLADELRGLKVALVRRMSQK